MSMEFTAANLKSYAGNRGIFFVKLKSLSLLCMFDLRTKHAEETAAHSACYVWIKEIMSHQRLV